MTLDPKTAELLREMERAQITPYEEMATPDAARAEYRRVVALRAGDGPPMGPPCSVEDFTLEAAADDPAVWVRVYRPLDRSVHDGPTPLITFFHGGGWVIGDRDTHDGLARALAGLPAVVVSVDYRLAPEHPFPAAHEDCWTAVRWAVDTMGETTHTDRLIVAGDSAGGLLAAAMAQRCRDAGIDVAAQCLFYPALDPAMGAPSHQRFAEGYALTGVTMRWFYDCYQPGEGFSPAELEDLSGLAPAAIATAGYDPLQDEALEFGDRLRDAGVATTSLHFPGLIHGFAGMAGSSPAARGAIEATVAALRGLLPPP